MNAKWGLPALLALIALTAGCSGPRYVAASSGSKGQVKFLWTDGDGDQGIVKCNVTSDTGDLTKCRNVNLVLED